MATRKAGSFVLWGVALGLVSAGHPPQAVAQEAHAQVPASTSRQQPAAQPIGYARPAVELLPVRVMTAQPVNAQPEAAREGELVAVVLPPRRFGLEQLRRRLPYGTIHNPVIRYLTDDIEHMAYDD